ncbi:MAG TPA: hypothetical protein RMF84_03415, partial [Polyangiaceae bacterium LLY-WYZ-14_1]|nr:hypothetical protein [Polyangiaceae bacterium LLY-WYZ-14_1]
MSIDRRTFVCTALGTLAACTGTTRLRPAGGGFRCPPCGCAMDGVVFEKAGTCPECGMVLQPTSEAELGFEPATIPVGAGVFDVSGGPGRSRRRIGVHVYRPASFTPTSEILLVVPGAGRDGDEYRNAWLAVADDTGTLVAALHYPEESYDFAAYHLGGVAREVVQRDARVERRGRSTVVHLDDDDFQVTVEPDPARWLFADLDRVFDFVVERTGSSRARYLVFGHSAGGQILHRAALFLPRLKARRIVAANAGFYTFPDRSEAFPLGLAGTGVGEAQLRRGLGVELTVLLGELDDGDAAGGTLLHTPRLDARQGRSRLERGRRFVEAGRRGAERIGADFAWTFDIV